MSIRLTTVEGYNQFTWQQVQGNRPKQEGLYWINYVSSKQARLAYWQDRGAWGPGFYCINELVVPESETRQVYRVEPAMYVIPDQYQVAKGEYSIQEIQKNQ